MNQTIQFVPKTEFDRVRQLNLGVIEKTQLFADLCRLNTLSMIAYAGSGHIGSSLSSLDIMSWLYLNELNNPAQAKEGDGDVFFSSKGHDVPGLYAVMIACGLLPESMLRELRRLGGLPGHPDVGTDHIVANTGSLGMGISKAKGMLFSDRLLKRERRYFVLLGDGELQEGQIWESLASAANYKCHAITAIVDHNKFQSDTRVSETSDLGDLVAKFQAFGWHCEHIDGNDHSALAAVFERCRAISDKPKVVIADTVKGKGVSFMESTKVAPGALYRFHSGAPDAASYDRAKNELLEACNGQLSSIGLAPIALAPAQRITGPSPAKPQRLIAAYTDALIAEAEADSRIVALDGDLVLDTGLIPFRERFPDRFLECGIAEQDMVSQAGGMALSGLIPVVHSFACFLSTRPAEQIYNNASERKKVIYTASLAGLLPGGPGHSHQAVNDISILGAIPGLTLVEPSCADEVGLLLRYLVRDNEGSGYLRLVSIPCDVPYQLPESYRPQRGQGVRLADGKDAVIIGYGPVLLSEAWKAAELLRERRGYSVAVVNLPWLSVVDPFWLREVVSPYRAVFTLDNHLVEGGQGRMLASAIAELALENAPKLRRFGLWDFPECGQNVEVLKAHGLDGASLADAMADTLARSS